MPSSIPNGYFLEHSELRDGLFKPGSSRQFLCHSGYFIKGPDTFTCEDSGKWIPEEPVQCLPSLAIKSMFWYKLYAFQPYKASYLFDFDNIPI